MENKRLLVDFVGSFELTPQQINESMVQNDGKLLLTGVMQRCDSVNQNGRKYPINILQREAGKYKNIFIKERRALGELDHPESPVVNLSNVSHNVVDLWWDNNNLMGKIEILPTPSGNIAKELLKAGIRLGISSRGMGSVKAIGEGKVEVQDDFEIVCWDLVSNPSTQGAFMSPLNESKTTSHKGAYSKVNELINDIITLM
tara:strand:- start:12 stop:614 length:603 start_codon:yes stop_codon:yes gene_type:complete